MPEKNAADEIMRGMDGRVRGVVFQTDASYVQRTQGTEGLERVEARLRELGHPVDYRRAKAMDWYPLGLRVLSLLAVRDTFDLSKEGIWTMGDAAPKFSFIVKVMMRPSVLSITRSLSTPNMHMHGTTTAMLFGIWANTGMPSKLMIMRSPSILNI